MSPLLHEILSFDVPAILTALFSALSCALLGNFLVLRRMSLMGDAISHAVLPGIVGAFLLTQSRSGLVVFLGAAVAGVLAAVLIEVVRQLGNLETGAAMAVVFSIFFAGGVLMMQQAAAQSVDLDPDCLLHGQLELIFWLPPTSWTEFFTLETLAQLPRQVVTSALVFLIAAAFVA
ncbi:MAG: metal ABC transporter permease, partial [Bdellovibrionales bacterium]|nr:metal ABC transporter permease [Bdellovibrionales bacterium]